MNHSATAYPSNPSGYGHPLGYGHPSARSMASRSGESYLDTLVKTASPAKLRLMLIERAIAVAGTLASTWRAGDKLGANEYSITLLDILNELLSGIMDGNANDEQKVCKQVADLYVFLAQHLVIAEERSDAEGIDEIATVLQIEAETWRAVCARDGGHTDPRPTGGLNLQA